LLYQHTLTRPVQSLVQKQLCYTDECDRPPAQPSTSFLFRLRKHIKLNVLNELAKDLYACNGKQQQISIPQKCNSRQGVINELNLLLQTDLHCIYQQLKQALSLPISTFQFKLWQLSLYK